MTCNTWLALAALMFFPLALTAESASAVSAPSPVDADWAAFQKANHAPGQPSGADNKLAQLQLGLVNVKDLLTAGQTFYDRHPDDPRRWDCVAVMAGRFYHSTSDIRTAEEKKAADAVFDEASRAQWAIKLDQLDAAAIAARDILDRDRISLESVKCIKLRDAVSQASLDQRAAVLANFKTEIDRFAAKFPDETAVGTFAGVYVDLLAMGGATAEEIARQWDAFAAYPGTAMKQKAASAALMQKPMKLSFTAADGRAVDFAKLRGKVVLVDFWATWCGPCKAEIPNIVANYKKYHGKGFEVVGIALEDAKLADNDSPEERARKLAAAKKELLDFTGSHQMPWPQYFDGKYGKTEVAVSYGIRGIPAMFLLAKDGTIVSTNARGPKLEEELRRLLSL